MPESMRVLMVCFAWCDYITLQWRHNDLDGVSNHQPQDSFLMHVFRSKKISTLRVTCLCEGNSPVTGECLAQRASNAENVSIWWRHHVILLGLYSISGKTSYHQISGSLEAVRIDVIMIVSLRNLTGTSAALLPRSLTNVRAIEKV